MSTRKRTSGITERRTASGETRYMAEVYDSITDRRVYKTFSTPTAARNWRRDVQVKLKSGQMRAAKPITIRDAWKQWLAKAEAGEIRARGGAAYKPGVLRSYELAFEGRLLAQFGRVKVGDLRRADVQRYVDKLVAEGLAAQTIRNLVNALRVLMKWCVRDELRTDNPCVGVELPAGGKTRDRIAPPIEAVELLGAIQRTDDRATYAPAFLAGLRRGELMALRWEDVDLVGEADWAPRDQDGNKLPGIRVHPERGSYDPKTRTFGPPKSKKGARTLGIPNLLVPYLAALDGVDGLVFPSPKGGPFNDSSLTQRVAGIKRAADKPGRAPSDWQRAGLDPIGLHEARHTYASLMIAAGVNIKTISEWMGHSSVNITLDRYGHLLPGSAAVALGLLNEYLDGELSDV